MPSRSGRRRHLSRIPLLFGVAAFLAAAPGVRAAGGEGHPGFPWSMLVNVLLLAGILYWAGRKPIGEALRARREKMARALEEAEALRLSVERMVREYERKLAGLDEEIEKILEEARARGEKERERILARARAAADRIVEDARRRLGREEERIRRNLEREMMRRAVEAARARLREVVEAAEHRLFTETLIERLEAESDGRAA